MNREEYINELKKRMSGMSETEIADAVAYCEEYFDEAMDDEKAAADLGTPAKFAAQLKAESAIRQTNNVVLSDQKPQSMMKAIVMIMAGIFALPIAVPMLFVAFALMLTFSLLFFILIITGIILIAVCAYVVIISVVSVWFHAQGIGDILCSVGLALIFLGVGIVAVLVTKLMVKKLLPYIVQRLSQFYHRHKEGGKQNEFE